MMVTSNRSSNEMNQRILEDMHQQREDAATSASACTIQITTSASACTIIICRAEVEEEEQRSLRKN